MTTTHGLPGLRQVDHLGFTVPDIKQAIEFFITVIGCKELYRIGPFASEDDWMKVHLNVHPRTTIPEIAVLSCPNGLTLEIFQYVSADEDAVTTQPRNSDLGGHHIAFYVEDMDKAIAHLSKHNVQLLGEPTTMTEGPSAGETWCYFLTPWGMQLELVSSPDGKAYNK